MTHVYTLQIRYRDSEDDIYLFTTRDKAEKMVFEYFTQNDEEYPPMTLIEFEHYLFAKEIGYFTIDYKQINPRSCYEQSNQTNHRHFR